jgi:hypothetical protein
MEILPADPILDSRRRPHPDERRHFFEAPEKSPGKLRTVEFSRSAPRRANLTVLAPQFRGLIPAERPMLQAIYDVESPHMAFGRVALIGDAAFVAPHADAGVAKAAQELRDAMEDYSGGVPVDLDNRKCQMTFGASALGPIGEVGWPADSPL